MAVKEDTLPEATTGHVCPECGEEYKLAMHLGLHRKREHGVSGSSPKKATRKRSTSGRHESAKSRRKQSISSTLRELADLSDDARGRATDTLPQYLSDVIRRDADKIATVVATAAEKLNPLAWFVDLTTGPTGILTMVVGLSGVGRWCLRLWRQKLDAREPEPDTYPVDADGNLLVPDDANADFPYS